MRTATKSILDRVRNEFPALDRVWAAPTEPGGRPRFAQLHRVAPTKPRHRRRVEGPGADFDQRRRWLVSAAAGLFALSVLMLALLRLDSAQVDDIRPDTAVVAPSLEAGPPPSVEQPPTTAPAPAPAANARPQKDPYQESLRYAERLLGPWSGYLPRGSG